MAIGRKEYRIREIFAVIARYPQFKIFTLDYSDPYTAYVYIGIKSKTPVKLAVDVSTIDENLPDVSYFPLSFSVKLPEGYPSDKAPEYRLRSPWHSKTFIEQFLSYGQQFWEGHRSGGAVLAFLECLLADDHENGLSFDFKFPEVLEVEKVHLSYLTRYDQKLKFENADFGCGVCMDTKKGALCHRLHGCSHVFCIECLDMFYTACITEGNISKVTCMEVGCENMKNKKPRAIKPSELVKIGLVRHPTVDRYVTLRHKKRIEADPTTVYCPIRSCQGAAKSKKTIVHDNLDTDTDDSESESDLSPPQPRPQRINLDDPSTFPPIAKRLATCSECHFEFCRVCRVGWHGESVECDPHTKPKLTVEEQASNAYLKSNSQSCPTCQTPAQKSRGCNHMVCYVCKQDYCFLCGEAIPEGDQWAKHFNTEGQSCYNRLWERRLGDDGETDRDDEDENDNEGEDEDDGDDGVNEGPIEGGHEVNNGDERENEEHNDGEEEEEQESDWDDVDDEDGDDPNDVLLDDPEWVIHGIYQGTSAPYPYGDFEQLLHPTRYMLNLPPLEADSDSNSESDTEAERDSKANSDSDSDSETESDLGTEPASVPDSHKNQSSLVDPKTLRSANRRRARTQKQLVKDALHEIEILLRFKARNVRHNDISVKQFRQNRNLFGAHLRWLGRRIKEAEQDLVKYLELNWFPVCGCFKKVANAIISREDEQKRADREFLGCLAHIHGDEKQRELESIYGGMLQQVYGSRINECLQAIRFNFSEVILPALVDHDGGLPLEYRGALDQSPSFRFRIFSNKLALGAELAELHLALELRKYETIGDHPRLVQKIRKEWEQREVCEFERFRRAGQYYGDEGQQFVLERLQKQNIRVYRYRLDEAQIIAAAAVTPTKELPEVTVSILSEMRKRYPELHDDNARLSLMMQWFRNEREKREDRLLGIAGKMYGGPVMVAMAREYMEMNDRLYGNQAWMLLRERLQRFGRGWEQTNLTMETIEGGAVTRTTSIALIPVGHNNEKRNSETLLRKETPTGTVGLHTQRELEADATGNIPGTDDAPLIQNNLPVPAQKVAYWGIHEKFPDLHIHDTRREDLMRVIRASRKEIEYNGLTDLNMALEMRVEQLEKESKWPAWSERYFLFLLWRLVPTLKRWARDEQAVRSKLWIGGGGSFDLSRDEVWS